MSQLGDGVQRIIREVETVQTEEGNKIALGVYIFLPPQKKIIMSY